MNELANMRPKSNTKSKYRPVLSNEQLLTIMRCLKSSAILTPEIISCINTLSVFMYKIANNITKEAYEIKTSSLEESLGLGATTSASISSYASAREAAFNKLSSLGAAACTVAELELAMTHKIETGLISDEEAEAFALAQLNTALNNLNP